ncbi:dihydromonapterin reductase [Thiopseudomonas acetoxidans]|uniref:Dihydromonapterin reductase n=1 Tax=Thiopseudomonas acetoxidans TaxID=3041622 RepID=A0ABT7SN96_9GAMM|nr:dihydromonapterin reductase [Thiopseudomonas sp. CY1220]MDM7857042.1 dihydromonapterin reductase [Thiopseudomonas sp. CY1220]
MQQAAPILITGAAQRIGLHCAKRLVADGYSVIISYRSEHEQLEQLTQLGVTCIQADFSCEASILVFIEQIKRHTSNLRAIIHNASMWQADNHPSASQPLSQLFHVHMLAPYMINLACAPLLEQSPIADIIHISDDVTRRGSSKRIAYSATKAGMDNMTLSFAARFAPKIKVNTIAPALIMQHPSDAEPYLQQAKNKSVMQTIPGPNVVYQTIKYLLDCPYTTGTTLTLNGGRHLL